MNSDVSVAVKTPTRTMPVMISTAVKTIPDVDEGLWMSPKPPVTTVVGYSLGTRLDLVELTELLLQLVDLGSVFAV